MPEFLVQTGQIHPLEHDPELSRPRLKGYAFHRRDRRLLKVPGCMPDPPDDCHYTDRPDRFWHTEDGRVWIEHALCNTCCPKKAKCARRKEYEKERDKWKPPVDIL